MSKLKMAEDPKPAATIYHDIDRDAFVFVVADTEVLSLASDGKVLVYGRPCGEDKDKEVFEAMRRFLSVVMDRLDDRE